ncbi:hypothetical protein ACE8EZ_00675 [Pantoea deleyi]|uniref:hypothetical protein n=1 Tax=Pantoea deleyi TaxID=470932 RepID=UPI0035D507B8
MADEQTRVFEELIAMQIFFENENIKEALSECIKIIPQLSYKDEFEKNRNGAIVMILKSMVTQPANWDKDSQFNITHISEQLVSLTTKSIDDYQNSESIDLLFIILFRFYTEFQLHQPYEVLDRYPNVRNFAQDNIGRFNEKYADQINFTTRDMPTSILKSIISGHDFKTISDFIATQEKAEKLKSDWNNEILEKEKKVAQLKETLDGYETAFNFVALYAGFSSLGSAKKEELIWARRFMLTLGSLIPILIVYGLWHIINSEGKITTPYDLLYLIPIASLSLILIYYFRVSLVNYNSIRAQIMQIELRKSLCQFIQDYARYSKEISAENAGLLNKFEELIFSNIMASEDKIPSTFDGLEQIATLINAVKIKGK